LKKLPAMGELLGSRATTAAEKQRRSRALRALRAKEAAEAELRAYVRAGLVGEDEEALREISAFLADLPATIEAIRHDLDELRKAR
jgi:SOS response regulatory protein OraA/RecX